MNKAVIAIVIIAIIAAIGAYITANMLLPLSSAYAVNLRLAASANSTWPFSTAYFNLSIRNTGGASIKGMIVGVYVNGNAYRMYNVSLPEGKNASIPFNYTFLSSGTYKFSAVADPSYAFDIKNRGNAAASFYVNVGNAIVLYALNSTNATAMYNFTLQKDTLQILLENRNITNFTAGADMPQVSRIGIMEAVSGNIINAVIAALYGTVNASKGMYAEYKNGAIASEFALQGTAGIDYINGIISSFGLASKKIGNTTVFYNGNSTICTFFDSGYAYIFALKRGMANATCINAISRSGLAIGAFESSGNYLPANAISIGSSYYRAGNYSEQSSLLIAYNGLIAEHIVKTKVSSTGKHICTGYISNSICTSAYEAPYSYLFGGASYAVAQQKGNSTYSLVLYGFTGNMTNAYNMSLYLQNISNGIKLYNPYNWSYLQFNATCSINEIACRNATFNGQYNTATLALYNPMNSSIRITNASCYMPGLMQYESENLTINAHESANITALCHSIPADLQISAYIYNTSIQYVMDNKTYNATGILTVERG